MSQSFLENYLMEKGLLDAEKLSTVRGVVTASGENICHAVIRMGMAPEDKVLRSLCELLGMEYVDLNTLSVDEALLHSIPAKYVVSRQVLPVKNENGAMVVAISDPFDTKKAEELKLLLEQPIRTVISSSKDIDRILKRVYGIGAESMDQLLEESGSNLEVLQEGMDENGESLEMVEDASLIQFVNQIILEAVRDRASDIHIEPFEDQLQIRYRIDGMLYPAVTPPKIKLFQQAIISRIKIMADLNIAEKRLPQDGRIKLRAGDKEIDVRVSIIPGIHGEGIVLRLLDRSSIFLTLEDLGMDQEIFAGFNKLIKRPHGIILVTGPTGSGKSTTLYGALQKINSADRKIITIEDPVEYQLDGVFQIPTKPKIGFDFAHGLRSILRHDPDVIMVGEIRDRETADIAIQSALTGHLVFSTLHTNDSAGALTRLLDMGIEPYLVTSSIEGIMAQRLVRKVCPECKEEVPLKNQEIKEFAQHNGFQKAWKGRGCEACRNTGYKGRIGVFELLMVDDTIREMVMNRVSASKIKHYALENGMKTLRDDGIAKAHRGLTTLDEVVRVTKEE
jgi:type II secretion system protein E